MSTITRTPSPSEDALCLPNAAMMSVDATQTVADSIQAAHDTVGLAPSQRNAAFSDDVIESDGDNVIESDADAQFLNEVTRDVAATLSMLDAAGVDTLAVNVDVMGDAIPMGGVGAVAGFLVHATDTRPVTDSAALNLSNAVSHTAADALVDGAFAPIAAAENLLGSAAAFLPADSTGRAVLEGAQQVMPTAQVRGGLYAIADIQTAGQAAVVDIVRGEGTGGLYQSGDAIADSARAGDYGAVASLLQDGVDVLVPEQIGVPVAGTEFSFVADAR